MSYYLFPKGNINISDCFSISYQYEFISKPLSPSLHSYLSELEEQTDNAEFQEIQNELFPYYRGILLSFSNYSPEFFEIIEMVQTMHLNVYMDTISKFPLHIFSFTYTSSSSIDIPEESQNTGIHAIEAIRNTRNHYNKYIEKREKEKDIYFLENICENRYSSFSLSHFEDIYLQYASKLHVIIADMCVLKNKNEILVQLCMILCIQAKKGILFWKIGDTTSEYVLDILFFLSSFYEKMFFIKPFIMDSTKSEKYIVCKGFIYDNSYTIYSYLHDFVKKIHISEKSLTIHRFLKPSIPFFFLNKLEEINYIFGQSQLEQIHYILLLLSHKYKHSKLENIVKLNAQKTADWINKHHGYLSNSLIL